MLDLIRNLRQVSIKIQTFLAFHTLYTSRTPPVAASIYTEVRNPWECFLITLGSTTKNLTGKRKA